MGLHDIKIQLIAGLVPALVLVAAGPAHAEEDTHEGRWFQVELILFSHRDAQALDAEQWPEIAGVDLPEANLAELQLPAPPPADGEEAEVPEGPPELSALAAGDAAIAADIPPGGAPGGGPVPFQILDATVLQLGEAATKLRRSSRFKPLLHVAWRQPTFDTERSRPVLLFDGMTEPVVFATPATQPASEEATSPLPAEAGTSPPPVVYASEDDARVGPPSPTLIGTVRLSVSRYLHLDTDLLYRIPVTQRAAVPVADLDLWYDRPYPTLYEPQGPAFRLQEWRAIRGFRMRQSRRMRSGERHYLDHPLFGMVVLITPFEFTPPEADIPGVQEKPQNGGSVPHSP